MTGKVLAIPHLSPCVRMFIESLTDEDSINPFRSSSLLGDDKDLVYPQVPDERLGAEFFKKPMETIAIARCVQIEKSGSRLDLRQ